MLLGEFKYRLHVTHAEGRVLGHQFVEVSHTTVMDGWFLLEWNKRRKRCGVLFERCRLKKVVDLVQYFWGPLIFRLFGLSWLVEPFHMGWLGEWIRAKRMKPPSNAFVPS